MTRTMKSSSSSTRAKNAHSKTTKQKYQKNIIALVYDFDGTLSPKPMQEYTFLPQIGVSPKKFWSEVNKLTKEHEAEGLITYMHLMYKKAKAKGIEIRRQDLVNLGENVELFHGVTEWFENINQYIKELSNNTVSVRHYLVSSGLKEIVEGTSIYPHFHNVFASEYLFEAYDLPYPKRVITDTSKTQYLFRINKGIENLNDSINKHMPESERPIPFQNMIYFGDGETDVPSMTVMRKNGGHAIAVYPPRGSKENCIELFRAKRVDFFATANFKENSELYKRTTLLINKILSDIYVSEEMWKLEKSIK